MDPHKSLPSPCQNYGLAWSCAGITRVTVAPVSPCVLKPFPANAPQPVVGHPKHPPPFFKKMSSAFKLSTHEFMNATALSCAEDTILQHPSTASAFYILSAFFSVMNPEPRGKMCDTNVAFVAEHLFFALYPFVSL